VVGCSVSTYECENAFVVCEKELFL
jgi:hypothetical protein